MGACCALTHYHHNLPVSYLAARGHTGFGLSRAPLLSTHSGLGPWRTYLQTCVQTCVQDILTDLCLDNHGLGKPPLAASPQEPNVVQVSLSLSLSPLFYTLRKKGTMQNLKRLFGSRLKNPFGSRQNPFGFHVESIPQRELPGTKKGSLMGTAKEPFWNPFI